MSRIGKQPIAIPDGVNVAVDPGRVTVNGPLGELTQNVPARMLIEKEDGQLLVKRPTERGDDRALHGLTRSLVANMVEGVTNGFEKRLEIQGVGYRATLRGTALELNVGYSHPVVIDAPAGITFEVPVQTEVIVKGIDKQQVGEIAAEIRAVRKPEPYKGKGIATAASTCAGRSGSGRNGDADRQKARIRRHRRVRKTSRGRPSGRGSSSSARTAVSRRSSSTTSPARRLPPRAHSGSSRSRGTRSTRPSRWARASPQPRSRPGSSPRSSTGAATCTTGA
jgi:large subunit ribosomal protein L6